ncbi:MAG: ABC transporter ATP-binding protein [Fimbriimonadaceae bacterium]|nr:MAG: ABC transporter ATP-binding protein [Fimbriimonadaceae bacterium]
MLEVKSLTKRYGQFEAVTSVDFALEPGEIMGFIGSNGAGKTTTIKMLATLLEPTHGTALLNGRPLDGNDLEIRKQIGYMPDFFGLYEDIKVWEYLDMFATLYGVEVNDRPRVIDEVLELTDLGFKKQAFARSLSRGMQQRLCLARCLVHNPTMLLLDEPASGLDPRARAELKELIGELGRMGKIVIVSSHILPELADFSTVVGIIERGQMLAFGKVNDVVRSLTPAKKIQVKLLDRGAEASMFLHSKEHVSGTQFLNPNEFRFDFTGTLEDQHALLKAMIDAGFPIIEFMDEEADLEDLFMQVTKGALN